jgi:signal transduction histidine kinase
MRKIVSELRPSLLDDLGLIPAIEWQVKEFQKRTGTAHA